MGKGAREAERSMERKEAKIFLGSAHRVVPFLCTEIPGQEV